MVEEWDAISVEAVNNLVYQWGKRCKLALEKNGIGFHIKIFIYIIKYI